MGNTICAPATAMGGAIAIIRVSGPESFDIVGRLWAKDISKAKGNTTHYGQLHEIDSHEVIDEVLVTVFRAPHSYTGEDSVEISCHGSRYIVDNICKNLVMAGCTMAGRGEFTKRAFMNGKMDLSQAEAVADLIAADSKAAHDVAFGQLRGGISTKLAQLREKLLRFNSLLELELDFADHEELEFVDRKELTNLAIMIDNEVVKLASTFNTGQAIKNGIPVTIVGKTNVGKSTLLNQLLKDDKAIVSNIHGTTRDIIEDTINISGQTFRFIDTAGLRQTTDEVEQLGIERTIRKIWESQIIIWVIDEIPTEKDINDFKMRFKDKSVILVLNKSDIHHLNPITIKLSDAPISSINISAKHGIAIDALEKAIVSAADIPPVSSSDIIITNARHYDALCNAHDHLAIVINNLKSDIPSELISEDIQLALSDFATITGGKITSTETLSNIFKHFCVGK